MFARCTTMETDPGMIDDVIGAVRGRVLDEARALPGFKGMLTFVDRSSGKGISFTLWESEEARESTVDKANTIRQDLAESVQGRIVGVEDYELVVDER